MDKQKSVVTIARGRERLAAAREAIGDQLGAVVRRGDRVTLKINQVGALSIERGSTVHPDLVGLVAELAKEAGARAVCVADDPGRYRDTMAVFDALGTTAMARRLGLTLVDLRSEPHPVHPLPGGLVAEEVEFSAPLKDCDVLIGVTKLKTHHQAGMTAALKNMFGAVPDHAKRFYHRRDLDRALVDINRVRRPDFSVVDALPAMEGLGPHAGKPVPLGLTIAGADPVAVDAVGAAVMGFVPGAVRHVHLAAGQGLGASDLGRIEVRGVPVALVVRPFQPALDHIREQVAGQAEIVGDTSHCLGCAGVVGTVFMLLLRYYDQSVAGAAGSTVYLGRPEREPDPADPRTFIVGDCLRRYADHPRYVPGCPPSIVETMAWISPVDTRLTLFGAETMPRS